MKTFRIAASLCEAQEKRPSRNAENGEEEFYSTSCHFDFQFSFFKYKMR